MRHRSLLGAGASLALLALFVVVLGPVALAGAFADVSLPVFALGLLAMVATLLCWSEALRPLLVDAGDSPSRWRLLVAYTAAMLGRQVVPMGAVAGPAFTAYTVDREVSLTYDESLAVVSVAEFISVVASLVLAALGLPYLLVAAPAVPLLQLFVLAVAAFTAFLAVVSVTVWYRRRTVERAVVGVVRFLRTGVGRFSGRLHAALAPGRATAGVDRFYRTVDTLAANPRSVAVSYGWHQVGWLSSALPLYTSALALDVGMPLALAFFLVPASHLVAVLPLPGGLGGVELVLAGVLAVLLGVDPALAGAVALLYRLCSFWFLVLLGGLASVYSATAVADYTV